MRDLMLPLCDDSFEIHTWYDRGARYKYFADEEVLEFEVTYSAVSTCLRKVWSVYTTTMTRKQSSTVSLSEKSDDFSVGADHFVGVAGCLAVCSQGPKYKLCAQSFGVGIPSSFPLPLEGTKMKTKVDTILPSPPFHTVNYMLFIQTALYSRGDKRTQQRYNSCEWYKCDAVVLLYYISSNGPFGARLTIIQC